MVTLFFKQFARYPSLYVLGAFPAWLKVLSRNFGAVLLEKPKNVCDSVPLKENGRQKREFLKPVKRKHEMRLKKI